MPRETDESRLASLRRILAARAVVRFTRAARTGGPREDEGYECLLQQADETTFAAEECLREALLAWLEAGNSPNRRDESGDDVRGDPATFYEFRLTVRDTAIYVKAAFDDDDPDDPELRIMSVKRQW